MSHLRSPRAMIWPTLRAIEISFLARKRGTLLAHCLGRKAGIHQSIGGKTCDRPSASLCARGWWSGRACSLCHFPNYAEDIRNDPVKVPEYRLESPRPHRDELVDDHSRAKRGVACSGHTLGYFW